MTQTLRLGQKIIEILKALLTYSEAQHTEGSSFKPTELLCSREALTTLMLGLGTKKCTEWQSVLNGRSDNYVLNHLAIQIGWLIGYFAHIENRAPDNTHYFYYGLPLLTLYRQHTYRLKRTCTPAFQRASSLEMALLE
jgi:hypothetical protein